MLGAAPWLGRFCLRWPGLVVFAVVIAFSALLSTLLGPQPHAQSQGTHPTDQWVADGGTVELDKTGPYTLTIREGETASYSMQLTKRPHNQDGQNDGWWVRIIVAGSNRIDGFYDADEDGDDDISWVPSVGRQFDLADWNGRQSDDPGPWRNVSIRALEDPDNEDQIITISHELWDHNTYCPPALHGGGSLLAVLTVRIIDDDNNSGDETTEDNDNEDDNNGDGNGNDDDTGNNGGNGGNGGNYPNTNTDGGTDGNNEDGEENNVGDVGDPGLPKISIADTTVEEGDTARFVVTLSPASDQTVTVRYKTADGTADEGTDYRGVSRTLTFVPDDTEQTILVWSHEDDVDDPNETFTAELSNPIGATLEDGSATGTIIEYDESVPLPKLSIVDTTVVEGGTAQFTVRLSPASEQTVTVSYRTASGTAVAGRDFDTASGTLTFAPGNTRQSIAVPTREDDLDEPNETFTVRLNNAIGATLEDASAMGTIIDDDVPVPPPTLSITDATVVEGETARFAVRLSPASEQTVTVSYRTVGGTAAAGQDFDAASGTLTFAPGTTRQIIAVPTQDDALDEPDETFLVTLSNPSGATLEDGSATGTIIDDDVPVPPPTLSIADATVVEGETARFAVGLSRASEQTVTVSYRTAGGTAAAGRDFDAASGTLTFGPRTTQQVIAVPTREDKLDEPDETFLVTLSNPNGATIQDGTATGTIADDDVRSLAPINRELLPEIGRALAFTAVRCRIEQAFSDMARGWAEPVVSPSLSVPPISSGLADGDGGSLELEDILANTSFLLPLMGGNGGTIQFSTWGCGDYRSLAGDGGGDAGAWDGEAFSVQVGADAIVGRDLLAGVSLSQSRGSLDFDGPGGSDPAGGRYDLGLTGVHPYLGWWISPDLELWGTFGLAGGDLQVVDDAAGSSATSAATLASATVGINGRLMTYGAATLRLKGEGSLAQLDVSKGTGLFQGASANLQRLRLAAEVEYEHVIPDVGVLVPWGELGLRYEGGDGATGSSLELGGGLHYRNIEQGWNAEAYGRWLAVQDDAPLQEQGFGLRFRYDPETPGFGPWVSLTQTWGEPASALHRLWDDGASELTAQGPVERRLGVEVGYGFPAFGGRAALMPYSAVSLEDSDARGYRLGMRVSLGSSGLLSLETERRERPAASADHRIMLRAIARF